MTDEEKKIGWAFGVFALQLVYAIAYYMGLMDSTFGTLYYVAYIALHVFNWLTDGFGSGVPIVRWRETRRLRRKAKNKELL